MKYKFTIILLTLNFFFGCTQQEVQDSSNSIKTSINKDSLKVGDVIKCPTISHRIGGGSLNENSIDSVKVIANIVKDHPKFIFEISYHTDHRGASHANLELSEKHSNFLRLYLIKEYNIEPKRIIAKGYGESNPIIQIKEIDKAENSKKEKLFAINRRYELKVLKEISNDK
jgi:outer membrane protein OmpA-like peptidoglycan-associated protein